VDRRELKDAIARVLRFGLPDRSRAAETAPAAVEPAPEPSVEHSAAEAAEPARPAS
jgi:hypothetical protein